MTNVNTKILQGSNFVEACYTAQIVAFSNFEYGCLREIILKNGTGQVLDVGTGTGEYLKGLAVLVPGVSFTAIDADEKLIEIANKKNAAPNICFRNQFFGPDFPSETYDLILARFAVEHMLDVPGFISEACKRLNNGGLILITEYYIDDLHSKNATWRLFRKKEHEFYLKFGSHPGISTLLPGYLRETGFGEVDSFFRHITPSIVGRDPFYNLIIAYTNLYHRLDEEIFTGVLRNRITRYCEDALKDESVEDGLMVSYTTGRKRL